MKRYEVCPNERTCRIANIDFPNWDSFEDKDVYRVIAMILKDLKIDLRFRVENHEIDNDPESEYTILGFSDRIEIIKDTLSLIVTKDNDFVANIDIN